MIQNGCFRYFLRNVEQVELPFEVFAERRSMRQKLLKARRIFLIFDLLGAISRVEIVLKFTSVIDLVKCVGVIARRLIVAVRIA